MPSPQKINTMLPINQIHTMDCLQGLATMGPDCVQCAVTSPPYIGFEINPAYVKLAKDRLSQELGLFSTNPA